MQGPSCRYLGGSSKNIEFIIPLSPMHKTSPLSLGGQAVALFYHEGHMRAGGVTTSFLHLMSNTV